MLSDTDCGATLSLFNFYAIGEGFLEFVKVRDNENFWGSKRWWLAGSFYNHRGDVTVDYFDP